MNDVTEVTNKTAKRLEVIKNRFKELKDFTRILAYDIWDNDIPLKSVLGSEGNLKIPSSTAIFNMGSATDCPSLKLGLCKAYFNGKHICYAKKAEGK